MLRTALVSGLNVLPTRPTRSTVTTRRRPRRAHCTAHHGPCTRRLHPPPPPPPLKRSFSPARLLQRRLGYTVAGGAAGTAMVYRNDFKQLEFDLASASGGCCTWGRRHEGA